MKLNFMNFCFLGAENWPNSNFRALKIDKKGNFELLPSLIQMSKIPKNSNLRAAKMVKHGSF